MLMDHSVCNEMEKFGKGIGNEARYHIIEVLLKKRKTVGELVKVIKLSQPAISQHLKILKSYNLVVDERRGQEVFYTLNSRYMLNLLKNLLTEVNKTKTK